MKSTDEKRNKKLVVSSNDLGGWNDLGGMIKETGGLKK